MRVVFFEDIEGTAQIGDIKDVKPGFARNYLLPRGLAGPPSKENLYRAGSLAEQEARRQAKLDAEWQPIAEQVKDYTVTLEARVGESGRLFGSITNRDIAEEVNKKLAQPIDPRTVLLPEPLRELGTFDVAVKFTRNITQNVTVQVVPDEASKPIVERLEAERAAREEEERKREEAALYRAQQDAKARGEFVAGEEDEDETESEDEAEDEAEVESLAAGDGESESDEE